MTFESNSIIFYIDKEVLYLQYFHNKLYMVSCY